MKEAKKTIIYVFERRHSYEHDEKMFGMQYFRNKGYDIEVWSLVEWTFPGIAFPANGSRASHVHYIPSREKLTEQINRIQMKDCYFLVYPYHAYCSISYQLRKELKNAGFRFSNLTESPTIGNILEGRKKKPEVLEIPEKILRMILLYWGGVIRNKPKWRNGSKDIAASLIGGLIVRSEYNFVTTETEFDSFPNRIEKYSKRNILLHSESYEEYLEIIRQSREEMPGNYIVFIDQYLTGHSDFKKQNRKMPIQDSEKYFSEMCCLFKKIESRYQCRVIIAAHPKAEYSGDEFGGRKLVYYQTNTLIRDANLVLVQYSTAFGLIPLFEKDYLQIYSEEMFQNCPELKDTYAIHCEMCGSKILNISNREETENWENYVQHYSNNAFEEYKDKLLISKQSVAADISMFQVMADMISQN